MAEQYWICENCCAQNKVGVTECVVCGTHSETAQKLAEKQKHKEAKKPAESKKSAKPKEPAETKKPAADLGKKKSETKPAVKDPARPRMRGGFEFWYRFIQIIYAVGIAFFFFQVFELRSGVIIRQIRSYGEIKTSFLPFVREIFTRLTWIFKHSFSMGWIVQFFQNFWENLRNDAMNGRTFESPYVMSVTISLWWIVRVCLRKVHCYRQKKGSVIPLMIEVPVVIFLMSRIYMVREAVMGDVFYWTLYLEDTGIWTMCIFAAAALAACLILLPVSIWGYYSKKRIVQGREIRALLILTLLQALMIYGIY